MFQFANMEDLKADAKTAKALSSAPMARGSMNARNVKALQFAHTAISGLLARLAEAHCFAFITYPSHIASSARALKSVCMKSARQRAEIAMALRFAHIVR